jgi:hypothetical protein
MSVDGRFTIGVFQDVAWARKGTEALLDAGFVPESLTIIAKDTPEAAALIEQMLGEPAERVELKALGTVLARGPLVAALQGTDEALKTAGLGRAITRVGFQSHDGQIYETLTGRGGVLVAVRNEPRAADALAKLHSYGGGNAAIGAWSGRL